MNRSGYKRYLKIFCTALLLNFTFITVSAAQDLNLIRKKGSVHPKVEGSLIDLEKEYEKGGNVVQMFGQEMNISSQDPGRVTIYLMSEPGRSVDEDALYNLGAQIIKQSDNLTKANVPIDMLTSIADQVNGVSFMKAPDKLIPAAVESEGVNLTGAITYHQAGYTGSGVNIAVIDVGFDNLFSAISNGELPADVIKIDCTGANCVSSSFSAETEPHGTAVAEIVYDMAPDASLYLIKIADSLDLKDAKDFAINNGIKIINLSGGWFNQNFYDGECYFSNPVCTANDAYTNDILWVNAAGNQANQHYEATFTDYDSDGWHNLSASDETISIYAYSGDTIVAYLTWNAWPMTDQNYDLYLLDSALNIVASSLNSQTGTQIPSERILYSVPATGSYHLGISKHSTASNLQFEVYSVFHAFTQSMGSSSLINPADASSVIAVGAINYNYWATGPQESYSSRGPTNDGRIKPDIMGPDNVSNAAYGTGFTGTSASSPHVASAAALIMDKYPGISVDQLWILLTSTAIDMGSTGKDNIYGHGRLSLDINAAIPGDTPSITSPVPGSTLNGSTVTFSWSANGETVTEWWLYVGTSVGGMDIYDSGSLDTSTSTTVSGLPTDESTVYVRLWHKTGGSWDYLDAQYTAFISGGTTSITTSKSTYTAAESIVVNWSNGPGNLQDWIGLSLQGSSENEYVDWTYIGGSSTGSHSFSSLPAGSYEARFYLDNGWTILDTNPFVVTGGGTPSITSPVPGSTLNGSTVTFSWSANGETVTEWWLYVGTSVGGEDLYDSGDLGTSTSTTVSGLPTDGRTVYARLWYQTSGSWQRLDVQYTTSAGGGTPSITTPAPGSTLSGSTVTFSWSANGASVSEWELYVGTSPGANDIHNSGSLGTSTSTTVSGLPTDGSAVYVRLRHQTGGLWEYVDFQYTAYSSVGTPSILTPVPGSTLNGATVTSTWSDNGTSVSKWWLYVGTSVGGRDILDSGDLGTSTSTTVSGLPTNGSTVYVRLWYYTGGSWDSVDFQYTAFTEVVVTPSITNPSPGSTLSGATVTFSWSANGTSVSKWWLYVGSSVGGKDIHDSGDLGTSTTTTVSELPTDGSMVYVRLWYQTGGLWESVDFQYTAFGG